MNSIGYHTKLCAVIGNPISHSMSPAIHNAGYDALDLDFVYFPCEVEDVKGMLDGMRAMHNFRGLSVTIPHKLAVIPYLDEINEVDKHIGSINTVVKEGDKLIGLGTDGPGALKAFLDAGVDFNGKVVTMLGCGGVARAIAFTLADQTALSELVLLDIDADFLKGLASDMENGTDKKISSALLNEQALVDAMQKSDVIINCTPLGMHPREDATPVPQELFRAGQVVFDAVYNPLETRLLKEAKASGCLTISGVEMFVNQAVLQFEHFTGEDAPVEVMHKVVMEKLGA
ncbi:MAG: shikimate dehydrogenase [Desulfuromonas sp.]|nr:MAG: shikimate dehydrogenase [Desulfuromonas sp.]